MKPTYSDKNGKRYTTSQIDAKIRLVKAIKLDKQLQEHNYNFCEQCLINASNSILDVSHTISVKEAKETGNSQLCWDLDNLRVLCRTCHAKYDKNYIQWR